MTTVLGIDIASRRTGWALINNGRINKKYLGLINIKYNESMGKRLVAFEIALKELIEQYNPDEIVIEDIYKGRNAKTFKILSLFRGVAIKAIYEITGKDPISIMAIQVRKIINITNNKEIVFNTLNDKYKLDFDFKKHNDIVDAIALCLAGHVMEKQGLSEKDLRSKKKRRKRKKRKK